MDSNHLHAPADAAFAADHLPAFFGSHAGAEADFAGAFHFADLVGVMHVAVAPLILALLFYGTRAETATMLWFPSLSVARMAI
jgi:hypothetical protein